MGKLLMILHVAMHEAIDSFSQKDYLGGGSWLCLGLRAGQKAISGSVQGDLGRHSLFGGRLEAELHNMARRNDPVSDGMTTATVQIVMSVCGALAAAPTMLHYDVDTNGKRHSESMSTMCDFPQRCCHRDDEDMRNTSREV
ncbi:hypothetical protein OsJ_00825 [Oryza sativa Japonica Group]|uniref:Uncharacterized protein n=1 Tax=Oryza sativa subsp. japonica TaxID=39947 RepID=B9EU05_ORYSJ|nr:hypothetical protein OsJ_00825 [Oryza sativa Japonica Group]